MNSEQIAAIAAVFGGRGHWHKNIGEFIVSSSSDDLILSFDKLQEVAVIARTDLIDVVSSVESGYYGEYENELRLRIRWRAA